MGLFRKLLSKNKLGFWSFLILLIFYWNLHCSFFFVSDIANNNDETDVVAASQRRKFQTKKDDTKTTTTTTIIIGDGLDKKDPSSSSSSEFRISSVTTTTTTIAKINNHSQQSFLGKTKDLSLDTTTVVNDIVHDPHQFSSSDANDDNYDMVEYNQQHHHHSVHLDLLDLVDWEMKSLTTLIDPNATKNSIRKGCRPSPGTPKVCCLGARSHGGDVTVDNRMGCAQSMKRNILNSIRNDAHEYLTKTRSQLQQQLLVPSSSSTNHAQNNKTTTTTTTTPWLCDICRIVEIARIHNLTIALVGDSMQTQVFYGLICELRRRNYNLTIKHTKRKPKNPHSNYKINHVMQVTVLTKKKKRRGGGTTETAVAARFEFRSVYMIDLVIPEEQEEVLNLGEILIISWGLHWKFQTDDNNKANRKSIYSYTKAMTNFFKNVTTTQQSKKNRIQMLIHRETSAQHFPGAPGGLFSLR